MRRGTRRVIAAIGIGAHNEAIRKRSVMALFEAGLIIGVQMMQVDPEFATALIRDFLGGSADDDDDVAMYWNADQTIAALREVFEADDG